MVLWCWMLSRRTGSDHLSTPVVTPGMLFRADVALHSKWARGAEQALCQLGRGRFWFPPDFGLINSAVRMGGKERLMQASSTEREELDPLWKNRRLRPVP